MYLFKKRTFKLISECSVNNLKMLLTVRFLKSMSIEIIKSEIIMIFDGEVSELIQFTNTAIKITQCSDVCELYLNGRSIISYTVSSYHPAIKLVLC